LFGFYPTLPYARLLFSFSSLGVGGRRDSLFLAAPTREVLAKEELHILPLSLGQQRNLIGDNSKVES